MESDSIGCISFCFFSCLPHRKDSRLLIATILNGNDTRVDTSGRTGNISKTVKTVVKGHSKFACNKHTVVILQRKSGFVFITYLGKVLVVTIGYHRVSRRATQLNGKTGKIADSVECFGSQLTYLKTVKRLNNMCSDNICELCAADSASALLISRFGSGCGLGIGDGSKGMSGRGCKHNTAELANRILSASCGSHSNMIDRKDRRYIYHFFADRANLLLVAFSLASRLVDLLNKGVHMLGLIICSGSHIRFGSLVGFATIVSLSGTAASYERTNQQSEKQSNQCQFGEFHNSLPPKKIKIVPRLR